MADRGGERGSFGRGFGGRGDRGRGRGARRARGKKEDEEKWVPCTKLGRLVQQVSTSTARLYCAQHSSACSLRSRVGENAGRRRRMLQSLSGDGAGRLDAFRDISGH